MWFSRSSHSTRSASVSDPCQPASAACRCLLEFLHVSRPYKALLKQSSTTAPFSVEGSYGRSVIVRWPHRYKHRNPDIGTLFAIHSTSHHHMTGSKVYIHVSRWERRKIQHSITPSNTLPSYMCNPEAKSAKDNPLARSLTKHTAYDPHHPPNRHVYCPRKSL